MAYTQGKAFTYGIPDGMYTGRPTTASCYEKDGVLMLDIKFAVKDPNTGEWYKKDNGYEWEVNKRHWLTNNDGGFNEATITGLREWAKGWNPTTFEDFYWFQMPNAQGVPFGNLIAIGEVELSFKTDAKGRQNVWVHDPNRQRNGRKSFVPDGGNSDKSALMAKWGMKAKALFAATPKKVAAATAQKAEIPASDASAPNASVHTPKPAPARPAAVPARPSEAKPYAAYPQDANGAFAYFCALVDARGEKYNSAKHDAVWFDLFDRVAQGQDPDLLTPQQVDALFAEVAAAFN